MLLLLLLHTRNADNVDEILSGIANGIDIDALGSDGRNALHWACTLSRTSICHVLLKKGASLSKKDVRGAQAIRYCIVQSSDASFSAERRVDTAALGESCR